MMQFSSSTFLMVSISECFYWGTGEVIKVTWQTYDVTTGQYKRNVHPQYC